MTLILVCLAGMLLLVLSTDQFVMGASRVAEKMKVSSVMVGAVILGCGTALPELALAFYGSHSSPWRELLGLDTDKGGPVLVSIVIVLVVLLSAPAILPSALRRHSPMILIATIMFAVLLRGSLDRTEGAAMVLGFVVGVCAIAYVDRTDDFDPFQPIIEDDYDDHGIYIEAPVMTPVQVELTRSMLGLLGTAIGSQVLAFAVRGILTGAGVQPAIIALSFVMIGSVLPHVVVALQALRQRHKGLAVGNLIGSNLFHSIAIGGLVSIIRPYQGDGALALSSIGVCLATAALTWLLLRSHEALSRRQGVALLASYVSLVYLTVS